ncbi:MAG: gamma-glutamyltransferase [Pseudomonadota bacterium]
MKIINNKQMKFLFYTIIPLLCIANTFTVRAAEKLPIINYAQAFHPVIAKKGMVASQEAIASRVGLDILKAGGNAVDAAVAVGFAMAVTLPRAGNIGGGGFMMIHLAKEKKILAIDYREMAPLKAHRDMFLDDSGKVDKSKARFSYLAAGVPGTVAGMDYALKNFGNLSWKQVLAPAIKLAEQGFPVSHDLANSLVSRKKRFSRSPAAMKIFFKEGDRNYQAGENLVQKDLANTLKRLAKNGASEFYQGETAKMIAKDMQQHNGLIALDDLKNYEVKVREPIHGKFNGYDVYAMSPPSSGGVHVIQMLNMLSQYDLKKFAPNSANYYHLLVEIMKRAYADRSAHLGDPDFYQVPIEGLIAQDYAKSRVKEISLAQATPSEDVLPGRPKNYESHETTHYSVVDQWGNAVSNTYTLNFSYGSGHVVAGTGILLNNEMDDFSSKKGVANAYGLLGDKANEIQARKRPLSSMTPTIVLKDSKTHLVLGSPGGSTIINIVLQNLLNVLLHEMNIATAIAAPRIHHQWQPETVFVEPSISPDTRDLLIEKGHKIKQSRTMGSVHGIQMNDGFIYGYSDPRRPGALTIGW